MKQVILYGYETCPYCRMTKAYLEKKGIEYTNYDVHQDDEKAEEMQKITGQSAVPVLVIRNGEQENIVIGYNPKELDAALDI